MPHLRISIIDIFLSNSHCLTDDRTGPCKTSSDPSKTESTMVEPGRIVSSHTMGLRKKKKRYMRHTALQRVTKNTQKKWPTWRKKWIARALIEFLSEFVTLWQVKWSKWTAISSDNTWNAWRQKQKTKMGIHIASREAWIKFVMLPFTNGVPRG